MPVPDRRALAALPTIVAVLTLISLLGAEFAGFRPNRLWEPSTPANAAPAVRAAPAKQAFVYANARVPAYPGPYRYGMNMGWREGWDNIKLATIAAEGGATSIRISLPDWLFEENGIAIEHENGDFPAYEKLGLRDLTAILWGPSDAHSAMPPGASRDFFPPKNLYQPIWLRPGVVNPDNYWAAYIQKTVATYKNQVRVWEVWNEPDYVDDWSTADRWWTRAPQKGELPHWNDSVYSYIRLMRVTYEVAKSVDPDALIATGGIGYESFLNALLRYTDDPAGGDISDAFPARGGAYFDILSYHFYPEYGALDPDTGEWRKDTDSDAGADALILKKRLFERELRNAGYDGATYPEKHWVVTETGYASKPVGKSVGGLDAMAHYFAKMSVIAQANNIRQVQWYVLTDQEKREAASTSFDHMGLYFDVVGVRYGKQEMKASGGAFLAVSRALHGFAYDTDATAALAVPDGVRAFAFADGSGRRAWAVWARTSDSDESASASASLPVSRPVDVYRAGLGDTRPTRSAPVAGQLELNLTGSPTILVEAGP